METYNEKRIDEIINEMSDCREDERNAEAQMVQIIAAAGTILGVIFAGTNSTLINPGNEIGLFLVSVLVFSIAFSYIVTIGIKNVLRYHYIQDLEDRLAQLNPSNKYESDLIHWMSFSSPITTRNVKHLKTIHTFMHFTYYTLSVILIIIFCLLVLILQYKNLGGTSIIATIIFYMMLVFMAAAFVWYFSFSIHSKKIYEYASKTSIRKKRSRIFKQKYRVAHSGAKRKKNSLSLKQKWRILHYFLYPKSKDLQKMFLVVFGFIMGALIAGVNNSIDLYQQLKHLLLAVLIFDLLFYQARYQWNDIRGLSYDMRYHTGTRLPVQSSNANRIIAASLITILVKMLVGFLLIAGIEHSIRLPLLVCVSILIAISILYELSKSYHHIAGIFLTVSMGYPLRIITGAWVACPGIWTISLPRSAFNLQLLIVVFLFIYALFGEMSVTLPWVHEVIIKYQTNANIMKSTPHMQFLHNSIRDRHKFPYPLRASGKLLDLWNAAYFIAMVLLSFIIVCSNVRSIYGVIFEVVFLIINFYYCKASYDQIKKLTFILPCFIVFKGLIPFLCGEMNGVMLFADCNQLFFFITYFYLKYSFHPSYNFSGASKSFLQKIAFSSVMLRAKKFFSEGILRTIMGKETYEIVSSLQSTIVSDRHRAEKSEADGESNV